MEQRLTGQDALDHAIARVVAVEQMMRVVMLVVANGSPRPRELAVRMATQLHEKGQSHLDGVALHPLAHEIAAEIERIAAQISEDALALPNRRP